MTDLATLLAAVRPRNRTDQFQILAALYTLHADRGPVPVAEVNRVLALHIPSRDRPSNVSSSLRKYTGLVSPSGKPGALLWTLTEAGVSQLRSHSGLALRRPQKSGEFGADVGIVCALEDPEFLAVIDAFGGPTAWQDAGQPRYAHLYRKTTITTADGTDLTVVGTTSTSMGLTAAAIATTHLIHAFRPRLVVMTGIAAGTRTGEKQFGDILIADPSVDYNSGKVVFDGGVRDFLPDPYPIGLNPRLRAVLKRYSKRDPLLVKVTQEWRGMKPRDSVAIHIGPLGAADQVIDDETRLLEVQKNWRKLIGVEMETYGVYRACLEAPEPRPLFVSMKAVCDFAAHKSDSWQDYAAYVSATFLAAFLRREWANLWQKDEGE